MSTRPRERAIDVVRGLLESAGFFVSDAHAVRPTSFDLLARRDSLLLVVKILKNIDALDQDEAHRLQELGALFPAVPLVVGQTSGATPLEPGVVYNRYGISIVVAESLEDLLLKGLPPFLFSSPGGVFAHIDGPRLRALREERRLSLGGLASVAGVSRRTIQLYEDGAGAEVRVVERLERYLGEPLALAIPLFGVRRAGPPARGTTDAAASGGKGRGAAAATPDGRPVPKETDDEGSDRPRAPVAPTGDPVRDGVFRQLDGMGWEVVVTLRCPFDAFTHGPTRGEEQVLLTSVGTLRTALNRAQLLQELARVIEGHAVFVVPDATRTSLEGLPIVTLRELSRRRGRGELVDLLNERENL